jgi:hypothetical protein
MIPAFEFKKLGPQNTHYKLERATRQWTTNE